MATNFRWRIAGVAALVAGVILPAGTASATTVFIPGMSEACTARVVAGEAAPGPAFESFRQDCVDSALLTYTAVAAPAVSAAAGLPEIVCNVYAHRPYPTENYDRLAIRGIGYGGFIGCNSPTGMPVLEYEAVLQRNQFAAAEPNLFVDNSTPKVETCANTNLCLANFETPCPGGFNDNVTIRQKVSAYAAPPPGYLPPQAFTEGYSPGIGGSEICRPGIVPVLPPIPPF